jgi:type IV secretory pathway TrbL component
LVLAIASPGAKLQITGGTLDGASLTDLGISSGLTTGRLGTFDASSLASISTRGDASSVELAAGSSATYYTGISATANNATLFTGTLRFFTSGSEKVRITPSGNVGIGTTSPSTNRLWWHN